jgi:hypothetical protein
MRNEKCNMMNVELWDVGLRCMDNEKRRKRDSHIHIDEKKDKYIEGQFCRF